MKSAEEWVKRVTHEDGHVASMYVEDIRAIQADALRHAADLCLKRKLKMFNEAHNLACDECVAYIEMAIEELQAKSK